MVNILKIFNYLMVQNQRNILMVFEVLLFSLCFWIIPQERILAVANDANWNYLCVFVCVFFAPLRGIKKELF